MLGAHADHFMLAQMRENVLAITPNAGSPGLKVPDRERAGTAHVSMRSGYGMPGPQRVVSSKFIPGRLAGGGLPGMSGLGSGALPGMGSGALPGMGSGALPGMGSGALPGMGSGALPGMGDVTMSNATVMGLAAVVGLLWFFRRKGAAA